MEPTIQNARWRTKKLVWIFALACVVVGHLVIWVATRPGPEDPMKARVAELLKHMDDEPDAIHPNYTSAVLELIQIGRPALKYGVLELLLSDSELTRWRASTVLAIVSRNEFRTAFERVRTNEVIFVRDPDWSETMAYGEWAKLWIANGWYDHREPKDESRRESYKKWVKWVRETK